MQDNRRWAFWRRMQYGGSVVAVLILVMVGVYYGYIYQTPSCFDGAQNGAERGVDCGGECARVCVFDITQPTVQWAQSFQVRDGVYNAVAYVENRNSEAGAPEISYTFSLYNAEGNLITERTGTTFLPPDSVYPIFESRISVGDEVPARTFLELEQIDDWRTASIGREQFVVRDRTLGSVDSRPRLDAQIYNTLLEDERDVEIIATIFDKNGNALTASQTVVPLLEAREERNIVFTWPEPIAKTLRSCEVPTDVMLAIDLSGSMNDLGGTPPEPINSVRTAASGFVDRLRARDQVGVVTFATEAQLEQNLLADQNAVGSLVSNLTISPAAERGSTNIGDAIVQSRTELISDRHNTNARKVIVLLTDGRANEPGEDPEAYARNEASIAKDEDITIFTIGLGDSVNQEFLRNVASSQAHAFFAIGTGTLDRIYRDISSAICEDGPAVIDIIPKTAGNVDFE